MSNIIEEYLVKLGWTIDKQSSMAVQKTMAEVKKSFMLVAAGFSATTGAIAAFSAAVGVAGNKLGNITTGVDKFALSLYTTQKNARSLQQTMDAMGIKSLDDLKYINLMPEQRQQFMELRQLSEQLAPDDETRKGLDELRKLGFQFQKMQIELASIGLKALGTIGRLMETPLFKKIPDLFELGVSLLAWIGKMIAEKIGKHPVATVVGGAAGGIAGAIGGGALGARLGSFLGPWGALGGGAIGAGLGFFAGTPLGAKVGHDLAEHKKEIKKALGQDLSFFNGPQNKQSYKAFAYQSAKKYGVDPAILMALINQESGWNPKARSGVGAIGIGQFMPATAKGMGVNPNDPYSSIDGSARYLKNAMIHFHGNVRSALASYNAGFGAVDKYHGVPPYKETQNYVNSITTQANRLRPVIVNIYESKNPRTTAQEAARAIQANGRTG